MMVIPVMAYSEEIFKARQFHDFWHVPTEKCTDPQRTTGTTWKKNLVSSTRLLTSQIYVHLPKSEGDIKLYFTM